MCENIKTLLHYFFKNLKKKKFMEMWSSILSETTKIFQQAVAISDALNHFNYFRLMTFNGKEFLVWFL